MSGASDALRANRACAAPWIKASAERTADPAPVVLRQHSWVEDADSPKSHECVRCGVSMEDRMVHQDLGAGTVVTDTTLDIALHWWCLRHPKTEVARLVTACPEARG